MNKRIVLILIYSLHVIATGLLRGIEAKAYKPNSLWFCSVCSLLIIGGAVLMQRGSHLLGKSLVGAITLLILGFYFYSYVSAPGDDATYRVGAVIVSSIGALLVLFFPKEKVE